MTFTTFAAALLEGVRDAHKDVRFDPVNGFTITEGTHAHKVDGEGWTFYLEHGDHGWAVLGWMEAGARGLSF